MAHYSIYIPKAQAPNPALLEEVGLPGLVRDGDLSPSIFPVLNSGPDGGGGMIFAWVDPGNEENNPKQGHFPDDQKWEAAPPDPVKNLPAGRYWFGFEPKRPPTPQDLERREQLPGYVAILADGNGWRLPSAQLLPHRFTLGADGREEKVVKEQYREVHERMEWYYDLAESHVRYDKPRNATECREYLAFMLSQNYRLNLPLCYWLLLFDESNWWGGSNMTVDFGTLMQIEEDLKKKDSAGTPPT